MSNLDNSSIAAALEHGWPGAQWSLNGDSLAGLEWLDAAQPRPTDAEIEAAATHAVLAHGKRHAAARINARITAIRAAAFTADPAQAAIYARKEAQARAYQAAGAPADASGWPLIAQEAAARGLEPAQQAAAVIAAADALEALAATTEAVRVTAAAALAAAQTEADVNTAEAIANAALT
jgi:hypothetical protein